MSRIRVPGLAVFWARCFLLVKLSGLQSICTECRVSRVYSLLMNCAFGLASGEKVQGQGSKVQAGLLRMQLDVHPKRSLGCRRRSDAVLV